MYGRAPLRERQKDGEGQGEKERKMKKKRKKKRHFRFSSLTLMWRSRPWHCSTLFLLLLWQLKSIAFYKPVFSELQLESLKDKDKPIPKVLYKQITQHMCRPLVDFNLPYMFNHIIYFVSSTPVKNLIVYLWLVIFGSDFHWSYYRASSRFNPVFLLHKIHPPCFVLPDVSPNAPLGPPFSFKCLQDTCSSRLPFMLFQ